MVVPLWHMRLNLAPQSVTDRRVPVLKAETSTVLQNQSVSYSACLHGFANLLAP
jgi:hypothetical protein